MELIQPPMQKVDSSFLEFSSISFSQESSPSFESSTSAPTEEEILDTKFEFRSPTSSCTILGQMVEYRGHDEHYLGSESGTSPVPIPSPILRTLEYVFSSERPSIAQCSLAVSLSLEQLDLPCRILDTVLLSSMDHLFLSENCYELLEADSCGGSLGTGNSSVL